MMPKDWDVTVFVRGGRRSPVLREFLGRHERATSLLVLQVHYTASLGHASTVFVGVVISFFIPCVRDEQLCVFLRLL